MRNPDTEKEDQINERNRINLAALLERVDHTQLIVALVATNPELEDILPEDPQLTRDVARVREEIATRQRRSSDNATNASEVQNIVAQHVHIHLWDQQTSQRVKELGASVVGLFQTIREQLIEAKAKYIDGDSRDVISFEEAVDSFKSGLGDMIDFLTRRDRAATTPKATTIPKATTTSKATPKKNKPHDIVGPWEAAKRRVETLPSADKEAVVRLAASAAGEVLDKHLKPVSNTATKASTAAYKFGKRDRSEPDPEMDDYFDGPPPFSMQDEDGEEDEVLYVVRSTTPRNPHYLTGGTEKRKTYNKTEAGQMTKAEAEQMAHDWSDYAQSKGYGYSYQIEEAAMSQKNSLQADASLSM